MGVYDFFLVDYVLGPNMLCILQFPTQKPGKKKTKKKHTYPFEDMEEKKKVLKIGNI